VNRAVADFFIVSGTISIIYGYNIYVQSGDYTSGDVACGYLAGKLRNGLFKRVL
jgi:hypothetical protein